MSMISSFVKQVTGVSDLKIAFESYKRGNIPGAIFKGTEFAAKISIIGVCATYLSYHAYNAFSVPNFADSFEEFKYFLTRNIKTAKGVADKCLKDESIKGCQQVNEKALSLLFENDAADKNVVIDYTSQCLESQFKPCQNVNKEALDLFIEKFPKPIYAAECINKDSEACRAVNAKAWPRFVEILKNLKSSTHGNIGAEIIAYAHKCRESVSEIAKRVNGEVEDILKNIEWPTGFNGYDEYLKICKEKKPTEG